VKAGDAKPWVYCHQSDYDRQAAEDHKVICVILAWLTKARFYYPDGLSTFRNFVPLAQTRKESVLQTRKKAMLRNFKVFLIALIAVVVAGSAYAFAAQNTVADSAAGYKASVVPGYTVTNIAYDLNATDPTLVDKITFLISPSSGTVVAAIAKIQTADAGAWTYCVLVAGTAPSMTVTCTVTSLPLVSVTALNVVASSSADAP
jgi:hypothetical protein